MKTGLLTFYHIHHYGAVLQAAALQNVVEQLGHTCEIIDYYVNQDNHLFRFPGTPGAAAADVHTLLHYPPLRTRYERFETFARNRLHLTPQRYRTVEELRHADLSYDVLLCGSDQIWNPFIFPDRQFDPVFFGVFSAARKVAYAPSFGTAHFPPEMMETLRELLKSFHALSVREENASEIVREVLGYPVPVVLDPTLLLSAPEWFHLTAQTDSRTDSHNPRTDSRNPRMDSRNPHMDSRNPHMDSRNPNDSCNLRMDSYMDSRMVKKDYILCYCINRPGVMEPYLRVLAEKTGLPVVQLCGIRKKAHPKAALVMDAGPEEFVNLFRNASWVCTNSFHGTVFSILCEKPFYTAVSPAERSNPEQSRVYALLSRLGLAERLTGTGMTAPLDAQIDWDKVSSRLKEAREQSMDFLRTALNGTTDTVSQSGSGKTVVPSGSGKGVAQPEAGERVAQSGEGKTVAQPEIGKAVVPFGSGKTVAKKVNSADGVKSPRLASHEFCTGCTACVSVCPHGALTMRRDPEGFLFPRADGEKCVGCGRCTAVCPALHARGKQDLPVVFAAWNRDETVRRESSSGGVFSVIADYVLEEGGAVFGAAFDARQRVCHTVCFRKEDLWRLRGAKYVQSDLRDTFQQVRQQLGQRRVLFSGTPCQVDGLYRFLGGRPENLITCDLVCHGVPSPGVWENFMESVRAEKGSDVRSVRFREKVTGWKNSHMTVVYENGAAETKPLYETEYGRAFGRAMFLRRSCYHCAYANLNRPGDFTLGDFWGISTLPEQLPYGISLLMVNTPHGSHIFDRLPLSCRPGAWEDVLKGNPNLSAPTRICEEREAFFASYELEAFEDVRKRYLRVPPLAIRVAAKAVSPELKEVLRKMLGKKG